MENPSRRCWAGRFYSISAKQRIWVSQKALSKGNFESAQPPRQKLLRSTRSWRVTRESAWLWKADWTPSMTDINYNSIFVVLRMRWGKIGISIRSTNTAHWPMTCPIDFTENMLQEYCQNSQNPNFIIFVKLPKCNCEIASHIFVTAKVWRGFLLVD